MSRLTFTANDLAGRVLPEGMTTAGRSINPDRVIEHAAFSAGRCEITGRFVLETFLMNVEIPSRSPGLTITPSNSLDIDVFAREPDGFDRPRNSPVNAAVTC